MKASLLYRIASILMLLFAAGYTFGFSQIDPKWGVDSLVQSMKSIHFDANGSDRTYWDVFVGFGKSANFWHRIVAMPDESKSEARRDYERQEADLFERLKKGEITPFEYQSTALETLTAIVSDLSPDEALWAQRFAPEIHSVGAEELARRGYSYPGNNPKRPN